MWTRIALITCLTFGASACVSTLDGETYSRNEVRQVQTVGYGTVVGSRPVVIEGTQSGLGTAAGGVIGGVAGSGVGDGTGARVASAVGAVIGAVVGSVAEEEGTKTQGIELTIRKPDNTLIAVVQEANENVTFPIGSKVQLIRSGSRIRAVPAAATQ